MGLLREVRAVTKPGCPVCGPRGDAYNQGTPPTPLVCALSLCGLHSIYLPPSVLNLQCFQGAFSQSLCSNAPSRAECHCKAGHVDKSKLSSKRHKDADSAPESPNSGSEASWAMEPKENKHKSRFAKLFHRKPKTHAASSDAPSVASSQASESSRYQVRRLSQQFLPANLSAGRNRPSQHHSVITRPCCGMHNNGVPGKACLLLPFESTSANAMQCPHYKSTHMYRLTSPLQ